MQYAYALRNAVNPTITDMEAARAKWLRTQPATTAGHQLQRLVDENAATAAHLRLFRSGAHELEVAMMMRPIDAQRAYELLGLMIGTLPPAVIFTKLFGYGFTDASAFEWSGAPGVVFLCLMMNAVCGLVGYLMGRTLGPAAFNVERRSWSQTILLLALLGLVWGASAGAAGGVFFFGIGILIGPLFAMPIGVAAFLVFGLFHRLLERGGMIDLRHFLPLATGITAVICATIVAM